MFLKFKHKLLLYSICSKISNTLLIPLSNKMLVFSAGIHKMLVRIANSEDPVEGSKISNSFHALFSNKLLVINAGTQKFLSE